MEYYTKDSLKAENELSDHYNPITDKDVNLANIYKLAIETSRSKLAPKPGDIFVDKMGKQYHIDEVKNEYLKKGKATIVENAYVPFTRIRIADDNIKIFLDTSGGPFTGYDVENMEYFGKQLASFGFFGSCGACANGQRVIRANVNMFIEKAGKEVEK